MSARARKARGRRFQNQVREMILDHFPILEGSDVKTAVMGEGGKDIIFSASAERLIPFDIECKNQEALSVWSAFDQARKNTSEGRVPLLVFTRNHAPTYAMLLLTDLLTLINKAAMDEIAPNEALAILTKYVNDGGRNVG